MAVVRIFTVLASVFAFGQLTGDTVLSIGKSVGDTGTQIETKVALASGDALVGLQIDFGFDPALVDPGQPVVGDALGSLYKVVSSEIEPNRLRVVLYSNRNRILSNGNVLVIPLSIIGDLQGAPRGLEILEVQLADSIGLNRRYVLAPYVEILTPVEDATARLGEPVPVEVEAHASSGTLQNVQLFVDGVLKESLSNAPYSFSWTPGTRGTHSLMVIASDTGAVQSEANRALYVLSRFDDWKKANFSEAGQANPFVSGMKADPDRDGFANAIEYLTGRDPLVPEEESALDSQLVQVDGAWHLSLNIEIPVEVDDLSYTVFATSRLDRANDDPPLEAILVSESTDAVNGIIRRTYRDPEPVSSGSRYMYIESVIRP